MTNNNYFKIKNTFVRTREKQLNDVATYTEFKHNKKIRITFVQKKLDSNI